MVVIALTFTYFIHEQDAIWEEILVLIASQIRIMLTKSGWCHTSSLAGNKYLDVEIIIWCEYDYDHQNGYSIEIILLLFFSLLFIFF